MIATALYLLLSFCGCVLGYAVGRMDTAWERTHGKHEEPDQLDFWQTTPGRDDLAERRQRREGAA
jgi:hypothetical protein